jgi:GMP synthase (glutamine-hydrolysing)
MRALAIRHVAFEDLGTLGAELSRAGFAIDVVDACTADLSAFPPADPDLLVVLGGPIGVYEQEAYPFVADEIALIRARLAAERPTLGICLGAQLMAAAAGAGVRPGTQGKEIGWSPLLPAPGTAASPAFAELLASGARVLHWHGDTFDLPAGASHLASTGRYPNQAFALGRYGLGLQFHLEVTPSNLERWYVGHACELAHAGLRVADLRDEGRRFGPALEEASGRFWRAWLAEAFGARLGAGPRT